MHTRPVNMLSRANFGFMLGNALRAMPLEMHGSPSQRLALSFSDCTFLAHGCADYCQQGTATLDGLRC